MQRILILYLSQIATAIECTPLLAGLKAKYPGTAITILTNAKISQFIASNPGVDDIMFLDAEGLAAGLKRDDTSGLLQAFEVARRLIGELRGRRFDMVINLTSNRIASILSRLIECPDTRGMSLSGDWMHLVRGAWPTYFVTWTLNGLPLAYHPADIFRRFVGRELAASPRLSLPVAQRDREFVRFWLQEQGIDESEPFVCIYVSAAAASLSLPVETFAELSDAVVQVLGFPIILAGSEADRKLGELVQSCMKEQPRMLFLDISLPQWAALFERTSVLITGNSTILHVASTTPTNIVAVQPENAPPLLSIPYGEGHITISPDTHHGGGILPRHILVAIEMIQKYREGSLAMLDEIPELAGVHFHLTHFDEAGFIEQLPIIRKPLSAERLLAAIYRTILRDSLDGYLASATAVRNALQMLLDGSRWEPAPLLAAVEAGRPQVHRFAALCEAGAAKAHALVELCAKGVTPQTQPAMQILIREMSELDKSIVSEGRSHEVTRPLSLLFSAEKDNLEGASIARLAQDTLQIYRSACNRSQALAEGLKAADRLLRCAS